MIPLPLDASLLEAVLASTYSTGAGQPTEIYVGRRLAKAIRRAVRVRQLQRGGSGARDVKRRALLRWRKRTRIAKPRRYSVLAK